MLFDDIDEDVLPVDPTKLDISLEPRYLDREINIRIRISDDASFNNALKSLELVKQAFDEEIKILKNTQQP